MFYCLLFLWNNEIEHVIVDAWGKPANEPDFLLLTYSVHLRYCSWAWPCLSCCQV